MKEMVQRSTKSYICQKCGKRINKGRKYRRLIQRGAEGHETVSIEHISCPS